ncbi:hypothetical protein HK097_001453, partial [Rhizophlyctis rosea]
MTRQGPPAASPLFRNLDEFEDAAWDDPTTMVPKHLLLFTTSLPELPRWSRQRVRSPSPTPRPSAVGAGSFSTPTPSPYGSVSEKKLGKVRPQSVNFGFKIAEGDPSIDVSGSSGSFSGSGGPPSLGRPGSAGGSATSTRGSRPRTASGAPDPHTLKLRRRSSNRSASRTPQIEGSTSTQLTQIELDVISTLLERSRQVKNHRWKHQQPVAVFPSWQDDAPSNHKYSREGSFSDSPAIGAVPPVIIPPEFRAPSPMFQLDDDDDDDDDVSNYSGSTGRSAPRAASPFLANVVRGPRRTSRTRKAYAGAGGTRGRTPSPPPSPDASSVSSARTSGQGGGGGGVTINRSLSDGDLSDYLKGFSELKDSLRVAKSTCNAEVQRIIVELQEFVEDHLQYNEDEPLRRKSNDDVSYRRLSTSTQNLYSPREIPDPMVLARSGSTPDAHAAAAAAASAAAGGGYFAYTPNHRSSLVQTPSGQSQSSPNSPTSGRSPRPSITKLHESVASDLCLAADEDAKTAPLTQAIHDLISIAQGVLEMDLASLMTPGACRDIISRLLGLQAKWTSNSEWPCRGHVLRLLMVFASVARLVEHLEEDTRMWSYVAIGGQGGKETSAVVSAVGAGAA